MNPSPTPQSPVNFGRYELLAPLGRGNFGAVYHARDTVLGRDVALKTLLPHLISDAEDMARFVIEARALSALRHPHIVACYDIGVEQGLPYFTMELVHGQTLTAVLQLERRLSLDRTLAILDGLCSAVDALHKAGFVHRDIKPANVMVDATGQPKLMDFGIVRDLNRSQLTQTGFSLGTLENASPEQVRGEKVGPAADIYALGLLTYHLLAGQPPFRGDSAHLVYAHVHLTPPPLQNLVPGLPTAVYTAIERALTKAPSQRPVSAAAFRQALAPLGKPTRVSRRSGQGMVGLASAAPSTSTAARPAVTSPYPQPPRLGGAVQQGNVSGNPAPLPAHAPAAVTTPPPPARIAAPRPAPLAATIVAGPPVSLSAPDRVERTMVFAMIGGLVLVSGVALWAGLPAVGPLVAGSVLLMGLAALRVRYLCLPAVREQRRVRMTFTKLRRTQRTTQKQSAKTMRRVHDLSAQLAQELARSLATHQGDYIAMRLHEASIDAAQIPGIGQTLKSSLHAWGVDTAADVSPARVQQVPGIGTGKSASLLAWRELVKRQAEETLPAALPPLQESAIRARYDAERQRLEGQLAATQAELSRIDGQVTTAATDLNRYARVTMRAYVMQLLHG